MGIVYLDGRMDAMTHTKTRRASLMALALFILAVTFGLTMGTASADILNGPRTTYMSFPGGTPTETNRTYCITGNMGGHFLLASVADSTVSNGNFALKVKDEYGNTLTTLTSEGSGIFIGPLAANSCTTLTFKNSYVGSTVPANSYDITLHPDTGLSNIEDRVVSNISFPAGTPTSQTFTYCNTDPAFHNQDTKVTLIDASVANGNFQLKLKEDTLEFGQVQLATWTTESSTYSYGTTKNGQCEDWVLRNGYVGANVPAVTYQVAFYTGAVYE